MYTDKVAKKKENVFHFYPHGQVAKHSHPHARRRSLALSCNSPASSCSPAPAPAPSSFHSLACATSLRAPPSPSSPAPSPPRASPELSFSRIILLIVKNGFPPLRLSDLRRGLPRRRAGAVTAGRLPGASAAAATWPLSSCSSSSHPSRSSTNTSSVGGRRQQGGGQLEQEDLPCGIVETTDMFLSQLWDSSKIYSSFFIAFFRWSEIEVWDYHDFNWVNDLLLLLLRICCYCFC